MAITYHDLYLNTRMALTGAGIEAAQLEARELILSLIHISEPTRH